MKYTFIKEFKDKFITEKPPITGEGDKFYYVYKILFENGEYYIGKHRTINLNDGYCGSGIMIQQKISNGEIKKAKKIILEFCNNDNELSITEENILGNLYLKDSLCLNQVKGGKGGWDEYIIKKSAHLKKGKKRSKESIEKQRKSCIGKKHSTSTKEKLSLIMQEYFKTDIGIQHKEKLKKIKTGQKKSIETKKKISQKAKERWREKYNDYWTDERKKENQEHMLKIAKLTHTDENRKKISEKLKEYYKTHQHPNTGKKLSEETKTKISISNKGKIKTIEHCKKISDSKKGKKMKEETKQKMSEKKKGRNNSKYIPNKIEMYDLNMNLLHIFNDGIDALSYVKKNINNKANTSEIFVACRSGKTRYNHKWKMLK